MCGEANSPRDRGVRPWGRKITLSLVSLTLTLVGSELLLRMTWRNPYRTEGPDRVVTLRLQHPHTEHHFRRAAIHPESPLGVLRSDDRSYILPSFQFDRPDCTIAFLGGSTTECCAVEESLRFPALVSARLADKHLRVNTLNAGVSGNTLHDSINNLLNHVVQDRPDIVVLMHACNDIGVLSQQGSYAARQGHLVGWSDIIRMSLMRFSGYSSLLGLARNVARERLVFTPSAPRQATGEARASGEAGRPEDTELDGEFVKRLRAFVRICHAFEICPILVTQPLSEQRSESTPDWADAHIQARFNERVRQVGAEENVLVVDLVRYLETQVPDWSRHMNLFYDGMHVNDRGSRAYGDYFAAQLEPTVREVCRRRNASDRREVVQDDRLAKRPSQAPQ